MLGKRILFVIGFLFMALLIFGCKKPTAPAAPITEVQELEKSEKVLLIVAQKDFQPIEYNEVRNAIEARGIAVDVASPNGGTATATSGFTVETIPIADVNVDDYIAVVIIGGPGTRSNLAGAKGLNELIISAAEKGKIIAAICLAPTILAEAGILDGVKATVWPEEKYINLLSNYGAIYVNKHVVIDGKIITGQGPTAAEEFATAVSEAIKAELESQV